MSSFFRTYQVNQPQTVAPVVTGGSNTVNTDHKVPPATGVGQLLITTGTGDVHTIGSGGGGQASWLTIGQPGQSLVVNALGTGLIWQTISGGGGTGVDTNSKIPDTGGASRILISSKAGDPSTTTSGGDGSSVWLPAGSPGEVLAVGGSAISPTLGWVEAELTDKTIANPTEGQQIFISTADGDPNTVASGGQGRGTWLSAGDPGQVLSVGGNAASKTLEWITLAAATGGSTGTDTNSQIPSTGGSARLLISTGSGDPHTAVSGGGGNSQWLAPGAVGQVLTLVDDAGTTKLEWVTPAASQNSRLNDAGEPAQILVSSAAGDPHTTASGGSNRSYWLNPGEDGQILSVTKPGTLKSLIWIDPVENTDHLLPPSSGKMQMLITTGSGDVHTTASGGSGNATWLQVGTPGQILSVSGTTSNPSVAWADPPTNSDHLLPNATGSGQLLVATGAGDVHTTLSGGGGRSGWLTLGTQGQVLTVGASDTLTWTTPTTGGNSKLLPNTTYREQLFVGSDTKIGDPYTQGSGGEGAAGWKNPGSIGQVLTSVSKGTHTGIEWADVAPGIPEPMVWARYQAGTDIELLRRTTHGSSSATHTMKWTQTVKSDLTYNASSGDFSINENGMYLLYVKATVEYENSAVSPYHKAACSLDVYLGNAKSGTAVKFESSQNGLQYENTIAGFHLFNASNGNFLNTRLAVTCENSGNSAASGTTKITLKRSHLNSQFILWKLL